MNIKRFENFTHEEETPEAKLRNQLTPLYSLADIAIHLKEKPELIDIVVDVATQAIKNQERINQLLIEIENKSPNK